MSYQIVESSPQAKDERKEKKVKSVYPYDDLEVGQSFLIPINEIANEISLRNSASKAGRRLERKFKVIKHGEPHNCFEVARVG